MQHSPTTHRVTPAVARAWLVGTAHPPGPGFVEVRRQAHHRRLWCEWVVMRLGAVAAVTAVVCGAIAVAEALHLVTL